MTQKEFQDRVKMQVPAGEYTAIEVVYMNSDLEKDEFCKMWAKMNAKRIAAYRKAEKEKQEKYEHISLLASTRELLRELAHRNGWNGLDASPKQVLSSKVIKALDKAGIYITEYNYVKGCTDLKSVGTLIYEINEYINSQVA